MTPSADPKLLDALAGLDADANMEVVQRTRRAVMAAAIEMREADARARRNVGVILLALGALLVFLTPMLWYVADNAFAGGVWQDAQALTALLTITTASTVFAVILGQWGRRPRRTDA